MVFCSEYITSGQRYDKSTVMNDNDYLLCLITLGLEREREEIRLGGKECDFCMLRGNYMC